MNLNFEEIMEAFVFADQAHSGQMRKGTDIPYIQHPRQVGILCLMHTYDQELGIAGFLHDTVEDTAVTLDQIRQKFGERVAGIVEACSEPDKTLSWEERKQHTIDSLKDASRDVKVVACADKLHNLLTMLEDFELAGDQLWERFKRGRDEQEWYYRELMQSIGSDDFRKEELFWFLKTAVECLFGTRNPEKEAFLLRHLQWLRGPNRIGMIYFTDTFQHRIYNLAMFGERVSINVCSPINIQISFDPELYESKEISVGFINDDYQQLLRIDIDDRVCRFIERYYDDFLELVHLHTCTALDYFAGFVEENNLLGFEPGHYLMGHTDDGRSPTFSKIADQPKGDYPISLVFYDNGVNKTAGELSRDAAKFYFFYLLEIKELSDFFVKVRTDAGSVLISEDVPLTPAPPPEQIPDQAGEAQEFQEPV